MLNFLHNTGFYVVVHPYSFGGVGRFDLLEICWFMNLGSEMVINLHFNIFFLSLLCNLRIK